MSDYAYDPDLRLESLQAGEAFIASNHGNAWNLRQIKSYIHKFTSAHLGSYRAELVDGVITVYCDKPCEGSHADGGFTPPPRPPRARSRRLPDIRESLLNLEVGDDFLVSHHADTYDLTKLTSTLTKYHRHMAQRFRAHLFGTNLVVERTA